MRVDQHTIGGRGTKIISTTEQDAVEYEYIVINEDSVITKLIDSNGEDALTYLGLSGITLASKMLIRCKNELTIKNIKLSSGSAIGVCRKFKTGIQVTDADYVAFYNRVIAAGGSLNATEQSATLQLVLDLKANSVWANMKAIYPMVGASAASCAQNLKSSSFTGTFSSGWTFASTGVTPNGASAYMNTGLNPSVELSQNNASFGIYSRTNRTGSVSIILGVFNGLSLLGTYMRYTNNITYPAINDDSNGSSTIVTSTTGFRQASRNLSTTLNFSVNSTNTTVTHASNGTINYNVYLGALNSLGVPLRFDTLEIAFTSLGNSLSISQMSNFYTAVQAFQTTLSRQV
jgi:hypothetical protein